MPLFDVYIAVDFSGSKDAGRQKSSIAVAEAHRGTTPETIKDRFSRFEVVLFVLQRLLHHNSKGKRVLCGFDFSYSFPKGFWHTLTGQPEIWSNMTSCLVNGIANLPPITEKPEPNAREWAGLANKKLAYGLGTGKGPFWGPGSTQSTDPKFPFSKVDFNEYRLTEKRGSGLKSIFKIGGNGTVGLQSLCGIPYLFQIQTTCVQQKVPLHCWPFDGWEPEGSTHCLVEWYPSLYNKGEKSHEQDALACVNWAMGMDDQEKLQDHFVPDLSDDEKAQAMIEGWVLGIL